MSAPVGSIAGYLTIEGAAKADQDILNVQGSLNLAAGSMTRMGAATDEMSGALTSAGRSSANLAGLTNKQRAAVLSLFAAEEKYNALLADEGASDARLASAEASVLRARDRVTASTTTATAANEKYAASTATVGAESEGMFAKMGGGVETLAKLGLAFGAFEIAMKAVDEIKAGVDFQKQMLLIQTNAGESAKTVGILQSAILKLSPQVATGPEDLATSMYHIASAGHGLLTTAQELDVLKDAAEGAKVGNADLEETTNALTSTVASGIKGTNNYSQAMGALISIVGAGDMKMSDLNDALGSGILATAKEFGLSLTDVGAALATFGDNNIRGAAAATTLRTAITAMGKPVAGGAAELGKLGLTAGQLGEDMNKGGLNSALTDLETHLQSVGKGTSITDLSKQIDGMKGNVDLTAVASSSLGQIMTDAFGKKAGPGLAVLLGQFDRFQEKEKAVADGAGGFGLAWKATQGTVSYALSSLSAEAQTAGITLFDKLEPSIEKVASGLAKDIPEAAKTVQSVLQPLESEVGGALTDAWKGASVVIGDTGQALGDVGHFLADNKTLVTDVVTPVLAMWAAYKGYTIAVAAGRAVQTTFALIQNSASNNLSAIRAWGAGTNATLVGEASETQLTSEIMQAELLKIGSAAATEAAAIDKSAAVTASAFADEVAASKAATDSMVADAEAAAAAAGAQARASTIAAGEVEAAATAAAATVDAEGEVAAIGWTAVLGPIGLVTIGLAALTFGLLGHKKAQADDNAAISDFTQLLQASNGVIDDSVKAGIAKQASDQGLFKNADKLGISTALVTDALAGQGAASTDLNKKLSATANSIKMVSTSQYSTAEVFVATGKLATKSQIDTANTAKTLQGQIKSLGGSLTTSAQQQKDLATAVTGTASALTASGAAATVTKDQFADIAGGLLLSTDAAKQYAGMLGFAADSNGNYSTTAQQLTTAIGTISNAYNTATATGSNFLAAFSTFSASAGTAADRAKLIGATLVNANGDLLSFDNTMVQTATASKQFGTDLSSAATDTKHSNEGFLASIIDLKTGTLDYSNSAAAPLISDLQGMQTAAMNAAEAMYQHTLATSDGTVAADAAVKVYQGQTSGALAAEAKALGLNKTQTDALAKSYFSLPADIKTTVEQEGADPVVDVLNQIGALLAKITGQKWIPVLGADTAAGQAMIAQYQKDIDNVKQGKVPGVTANSAAGHAIIDTFQGQINSVKQGKQPTISADTNPGEIATQYLQGLINRIRQGKEPGLQVGSKAAENTIGMIQGEIDGLHQNGEPSIDVDTDPAMAKIQAFEAALNGANAPMEEIHPPTFPAHKAGGGMIDGPGTGTSDSVPAMLSKGEFVETASATDKNYAALVAAQHGATLSVAHYATGGLVTAAAQAHAAASLATAQSNIKFKIDSSDFAKLIQALTGPTATLASTTRTLLADVRTATQKGLGGSTTVNEISKENANLVALSTARLSVAAKLKTANAALAAAEAEVANERSTVTSAITGGFDITTAGQYGTGASTATSIIQDLNFQVQAAANFKNELAKLAKEGLNSADIQKLAESGVTSSGVSAAALANATAAQIKQINSLQGMLGAEGTSLGNVVGNSMFGTGVQMAQGIVNGLASQEKTLAGQMTKLADVMVAQIKHDLQIHSPSKVMHEMGGFIAQGMANGVDAHTSLVSAASGRLAMAAIPAKASMSRSSGGPLRLHPADIDALALAVANVQINLDGQKVNRQLQLVQGRQGRR